MKLSLKYAFSVLLMSTLAISSCHCQNIVLVHDTLNLTDLGRKIENSVSFNTTNSNYKETSIGQKFNIKVTRLVINGDTLEPVRIGIRGQSTLYFRRKSYSFSLKSHASFRHGERRESLKRFDLIGLTMDKYYIRNRLAFEMMEASKLFNLFYSYCELRINNESEGICMVIERPEDWALKKKDSPLVIRRGYDNNIRKIKTGKKAEGNNLSTYRGDFRQIYRSLNKYKGEDLYKALSTWLEMDVYMKWLAFNFFVRNGDYTDEAFFYLDPATNKFSIIPWDYDDIFSAAPHEGNIVENRKILGDKLIFSIEDLLDKKIVTDPYLYKQYLLQFEELMNQLSPEVIRRDFENTYAELYPYYSKEEIINKSGFDLYKNANIKNLHIEMLSLYQQLVTNRNIYLDYLKRQKQ
jgi:spore coat protein H